jgi:hypothetical protein
VLYGAAGRRRAAHRARAGRRAGGAHQGGLTRPRRPVQNSLVARLSAIVILIASLLAAAPGLCEAGPLAPPAHQMACCKAGHYTCGKTVSARDCCKRMAGPRAQLAATQTASPGHATPIVEPLTYDAFHVVPLDERNRAVEAFKRPHDPPHLHAFTLLI